jgi:beta-lactamase regulating signal transducer with metallopeptidase domain
MQFILEYLLKFSISIAVMYIFYRVVLRQLTFYRWNRFYLLGYGLLCFVIPFINITPWVQQRSLLNAQLQNALPVIDYSSLLQLQATPQNWWQQLSVSEILGVLVITGSLVMLVRMLLQFISLQKVKAKGKRVDTGAGIHFFETEATVSPFSFGSSIYFNPQLHSTAELERMLQHEIVHVKQRHTADLVVAEIICIINWFNPFAWLLRNALRQNLEFLADHEVLQNGVDKKQYQYLLVKVAGNNQFSIAHHFNFSSLKKRIAMMNKIKTTRMHLTRFLFVLPVLLLVLLAFRQHQKTSPAAIINLTKADTLPAPPLPPHKAAADLEERVAMGKPFYNKKGYQLSIADNNGECVVIVKDKTKKIVKALLLTEWNNNENYYTNLYGSIPPPPPPPPAPKAVVKPAAVIEAVPLKPGAVAPVSPVAPVKPTTAVITVVGYKKEEPAKEPLYVLDGVVQPKDGDVLKNLNPNDIARIDVLKNESATKAYGEAGKDGVIIIATKKAEASKNMLSNFNGIVILNGVEMSKENFQKRIIKPENIISMDVYKDQKAVEKFGEKGKNGVIEIKTRLVTKIVNGVIQVSYADDDGC